MIILRTEKVEEENDIPIHIDEDDYIKYILNQGDISNGGGINIYYDGVHKKNTGKICSTIPFEHVRLQIGFFDQVYHGVSGWKVDRVIFIFSLQRKNFNNFDRFGSKYYYQ